MGHLQELAGSCSPSADKQQEQGAEGYGVPRVGHPATCHAHPAHPVPTATLGVRFWGGPIYRWGPWEVKNVAQGCWSKVPIRSVPFSNTLHGGWKEHQALELSPGSPRPAGVLRGTPSMQCTSGPAMPSSRCQSAPHRSPCNRRVLCTRAHHKLDHKSESRGLVDEGEGGVGVPHKGGTAQQRRVALTAMQKHPGVGASRRKLRF